MSEKLFEAISLRETEEALRLLDEHSVRDAINDEHYGDTCLYKACERQNVAVVKKILTVPGVDVRRGVRSIAHIHVACEKGNVEILRCLLQHDSSLVNLRDGYFSRTPLHWAARHNHLDCVQLLVSEYNADTTARDRDGRTALDLAEIFNYHEVATYLRKVTEDSLREDKKVENGTRKSGLFSTLTGDEDLYKRKKIPSNPDLSMEDKDEDEDEDEDVIIQESKWSPYGSHLGGEYMEIKYQSDDYEGMEYLWNATGIHRQKVADIHYLKRLLRLRIYVLEQERKGLQCAVTSIRTKNEAKHMDPAEKEKINMLLQNVRKRFAFLKSNLVASEHMIYLFSKRALSLSDVEQIRAQQSNADKVDRMLTLLLSKKDPDEWANHFMASLKRCGAESGNAGPAHDVIELMYHNY